jgi:1,2-diacylglycerol 3-beta-glucosyltransferase
MTRLSPKELGLVFLITVAVLLSISYTLAIFLMSRRRRPEPLRAPDNLFFVFVIPCLNEELVIGRTLDALHGLPGENWAALVVDDGSDDGTAEVVWDYPSDRVWLLERKAPEARQGKGEALNAAYRHLRDSDVLNGFDPDKVVVGIFDADGRIASNALQEIGSYFRNPKAGAVQIGVRMYNAGDNLLTRIQDFEFVTYTEIFQRARQRVGSVGLGGNGQFTRLAALESLGDAPWTDCLTEDLDLGIRLLVNGWENNFCPTSYVSQQGVRSLRRLIRQRSRWFQGHLQCWKRIPMVLFSKKMPDKAVFDLIYHLTSPALVLLMSIPFAIFMVTLGILTITSPGGIAGGLISRGGLLIAAWYLLSFGLAPLYALVYWLRDEKTGLVKAFGLAHVYSLYSYMWFIAGWGALARIAFRRRGWSKTARTPEAPEVPEEQPAPSAAA